MSLGSVLSVVEASAGVGLVLVFLGGVASHVKLQMKMKVKHVAGALLCFGKKYQPFSESSSPILTIGIQFRVTLDLYDLKGNLRRTASFSAF